MARYTGPVCRLCRRDGLKLFLKGTRCDTPKCAFERREAPPGMHSQRRGKLTDYGVHLREKQKVKHYYGVLERQFRKYFQHAAKSKGNTGDDAAWRCSSAGWTTSCIALASVRAAARPGRLICHGHITVNGRRVDIPSYQVRIGDVIRVKNRAKSLDLVRGAHGRKSTATFPISCRAAIRRFPKALSAGCPRPTKFRFRFRPN